MTPPTRTTPERPTVPAPHGPAPVPQPPLPAPATPADDVGGGRSQDGPAPWIRRGPHEAPADYDRRWRAEVYAGDVPQLTFRAVATGITLGCVLAVSNLYVGLKAGWALSVAITAIVLSTAAWRGLLRAGLARTTMSPLEQNCMQSTAAAAANTSSTVLVTALPAYMLVSGVSLQPLWLILWTFFVSMLGLSLAVPFKRRLLHHERLAWPSAVAAAQILRTLHSRSAAAVSQARWLFGGAAVAAAIRWAIGNTFAWWKLPAWPDAVLLPGRFGSLGIGFDASALYFGVGAILGPRVSAWMLVGSSAVWLGFAPWLVASGRVDSASWGAVMFAGALWCGAGIMIAAGITSLFLEAGVLLRGLRGLRARRGGAGADPLADLEVPGRWALVGAAISAAGILWIGEFVLGIAWWLGLIGVAVSAVLTSIAIRAMGETDVTPAGALGKVMQLGYGVAAPQSLATNLFGTTIVTSSATVAADTSVNLKCGHLLGAHPRRQFLAQGFGILAGIVAAVFAFDLLVPSVAAIGTEALPAPAAQAWRAVAELVSDRKSTRLNSSHYS